MENKTQLAILREEVKALKVEQEEGNRLRRHSENQIKEILRLRGELRKSDAGIRKMSGVMDAILLSLTLRFGDRLAEGDYTLRVDRADMEKLKCWEVHTHETENDSHQLLIHAKAREEPPA